ncbi:MAG: AF1514 family protein, partial [Betaproteobacteria bacterium]|nr:AF1514 family protein [Betaproteobacteria bacterium]
LDFDSAIKRASAAADELIGESMLLSWYDRERDLESTAHASECHEGCPIKGFWNYALNRGGTLAVDFDDGRFVFCFRSLGEFAPPR